MGNCGSARKPAGPRSSPDHPDLYAVYLRPRRLKRKSEVIAAMEFNRRWGGLHVTLCSFAPISGSPGTCHGSDLDAAMISIQEAGQPKTLTAFKLTKQTAKLPLIYSKANSGVAMLKLPSDHPALRAMCAAASAAGLKQARKADELHITIGNASNADVVREALWACEYWEVALAKSSSAEAEIRVNGFVDVRPLTWEAGDSGSLVPTGSGGSTKSGSGRRYHVYAPSLPSEYHGD